LGQKVHPIGFRLGINKDWQTRWFAGRDSDYAAQVREDILIRNLLNERLADAAVSRIEIERKPPNEVVVTIHTARPGVAIGRGGQKVEELRHVLEERTGKRIRLVIHEIRVPELEAPLVARSIAEQIERRVSHKRAMKQAVQRALQRGALGIKITVAGRLGGAEMKRKDTERAGRVPLQTIRADIDYGTAEALTTYGRIGVKVWIYKGDIWPERPGFEERFARAQLPVPEEAPVAGETAEPEVVPVTAEE
jgi:small subunit ribosomal protein S3